MTPTCRTCETKFPGKEVCKTCGADPNAEPTIDYKIERAKAKKPRLILDVEPLSWGPTFDNVWVQMPRKNGRSTRLTARQIARAFQIPTNLIVDRKTANRERAASRARIRSLQNTKTSGRRNKHGRVGVR